VATLSLTFDNCHAPLNIKIAIFILQMHVGYQYALATLNYSDVRCATYSDTRIFLQISLAIHRIATLAFRRLYLHENAELTGKRQVPS
jgi:hypothetical protein